MVALIPVTHKIGAVADVKISQNYPNMIKNVPWTLTNSNLNPRNFQILCVSERSEDLIVSGCHGWLEWWRRSHV